MSGGGGNTPTGPTDDPCAQFYKDLTLLSPVPAVVDKLTKGTELDFDIHEENSRKSLRVMLGVEVAGAITKHAAQLIKCIEGGHTYTAFVVSLDGGSCTLEARMKS